MNFENLQTEQANVARMKQSRQLSMFESSRSLFLVGVLTTDNGRHQAAKSETQLTVDCTRRTSLIDKNG